jgi:hypothetical protein
MPEASSRYAFARQRVEEARRPRPTRMPAWVRQRREAYRGRLAAAAQRCYQQTGIWFLARGAARDTDEQETKAVWGDLLTFSGIESLPAYSKANHRQAIQFWQGWQNRETGRLYNPLYQDPQRPEVRRNTPGNRDDYSEDRINLKYIPSILADLGAELPLPMPGLSTQVRADAGADTFDGLWQSLSLWNSAHAGAFPIQAAYDLDAGNLDKVPQVEAGMAALLRAYHRETGMWRPEPFAGFPWRDYLPSSGFKVISRICGYVGMEGFPEALLKTAVDNLLVHRGELYEHPAMARNYAETFAHHVMLSDYRHDEQLDAMEECLDGFRRPDLWEDTDTGCYCVFGSGMIGAFMNWEDLPFDQGLREWFRFAHGCDMKWRFVADPYGHWVNAIPKEPEAVWGHPAYDAGRHGLKARNRAHWARKVVDLVPQRDVPLERRGDAAAGEGALAFTLTQEQLGLCAGLHLKATWSGAYDVWLNGEPVKQVRYNLPDLAAGWHVPGAAAATLCVGENTIRVGLVGPGKEQRPGAPLSQASPFIRLGLIAWR